jgi:signal recognition particle subunit SRP54
MFEQISSKLQGAFKKLRGQPRLKEEHVDEALKEIRLALLEADVQFGVARDFVKRVRERSVGEEILGSLTAAQQVIKFTRDEMTQLLGGQEAGLELKDRWPAVILMAGLQGSGKTTTSAKLARHLRESGRHPALVSVDVRRPAALEQLKILGDSIGLPVIEPETLEPVERARQAMRSAKDLGRDVLIVDTAGRVHVDDELMDELKAIEAATEPSETLFVADSMTGQDAVKSASSFGESVRVTGHVLTKLDGDARGGAALSIAAVTGVPIKFVGVGEKLDELEPFHPDRMASRILGMGDVLSLIERAEKTFDEEESVALSRKVQRGELTLEDFRDQLRQMKRMGSMQELMIFLPGASQLPAEVDESELKRFEAILDSMTVHERSQPQVVNGSRRRRIASGSGTAVSDVNRLLKRFAEARKMMKKLSRIQQGGQGKGAARKIARMLGGFGR